MNEGIAALDLFAGVGWGVALQRLGIKEYGVELMPEAVATREMHGMETFWDDVWTAIKYAPLDSPAFSAALHIASPPCQAFSVAGKGAGRKALEDVLRAIDERHFEDIDDLRQFAYGLGDDRIGLVLTPLHYAVKLRPKFIVWEQVPPVLPVWEACAEVLRWRGYSVVTGVLNAEQYGVPQTRKRAILIATTEGEAKMPTPTHSKYYSRDKTRLDPDVKKWVSMRDALGMRWPVDRPSPTVTGGGGLSNRGSRTFRTMGKGNASEGGCW